MDHSIDEQKVVRESVESFSDDIDLGGGVCTSVYQERVLWVERVFAVTVLEHRGALIDELGRYTHGVEDGGPGIREAVTKAKWAASAMKIDASSDLVVNVWRVARQEPMVERSGDVTVMDKRSGSVKYVVFYGSKSLGEAATMVCQDNGSTGASELVVDIVPSDDRPKPGLMVLRGFMEGAVAGVMSAEGQVLAAAVTVER